MAIVSVNRINLPCELITIIKDYAFITKDRKIIMDRMNAVHEVINYSLTKYSQPKYMPDAWFFWIKNKPLICLFCMTCGNYLPRYYSNEHLEKLNCKCHPI